jgi:hypothetical protein
MLHLLLGKYRFAGQPVGDKSALHIGTRRREGIYPMLRVEP